MIKKNISNKIARLRALLAQLPSLGPFLRGSVVRLGPRKTAMLSLNKNGKTRLVYLGESRIEQAALYSKTYKRLLALTEEITLLLMDLLKAGVPQEKIWPAASRPRKSIPRVTKSRL